MEKYLFGAILILLISIAGLGVYTAIQHPSETASLLPQAVSVVQTAAIDATNTVTGAVTGTSVKNTGTTDVDTSAVQTPGTYTMAQVEAHNSSSGCYTAINGSVYDLTSFIGQHPGGEAAILSLCGTDGTAAFTAQHGGERRPENELASLKIGTLAK